VSEELLHEADVVGLLEGFDCEGSAQIVWADFLVDAGAVSEFVEVLADGRLRDARAFEAEAAAQELEVGDRGVVGLRSEL
jgi:hypothetical protein